MPKGVFITIEGTEGAGKSTLIREVAAHFPSDRVKITREPGGVPTAEKIRKVILGDKMEPTTELLLYEAARAEHLAAVIAPALARGQLVLCDRFTDSSLAYQGHARGLDWKMVKALNRIATGGLKPHLTVLLDIDPAVGLKRARDRNRFEEEGIAFQKRVRQGYLKAKKEEPRRWLVVKAESGSPAELAELVVRKIQDRFPWLKQKRS